MLFRSQMKRKQYKKILTVPVVMIVVGLVGTGAGMLIQNFIVSPDELSKETPYLERNIEYTQYAYQLDDVSTKAFAADNTLTAADIAENSETISNIRINDFDPAKQFYNQTQLIMWWCATAANTPSAQPRSLRTSRRVFRMRQTLR